MPKTSVYLSPVDAEHLRRAAARTGRSQADLIREGVRRVTAETQPGERVFRSMGAGHGGGARYRGWDAEELHRSVMGRR
jgi:Arc/MetJ-type ribon-helix-helix transcriptional regulator